MRLCECDDSFSGWCSTKRLQLKAVEMGCKNLRFLKVFTKKTKKLKSSNFRFLGFL